MLQLPISLRINVFQIYFFRKKILFSSPFLSQARLTFCLKNFPRTYFITLNHPPPCLQDLFIFMPTFSKQGPKEPSTLTLPSIRSPTTTTRYRLVIQLLSQTFMDQLVPKRFLQSRHPDDYFRDATTRAHFQVHKLASIFL